MKTIHKYALEPADVQMIEVPIGAQYLNSLLQYFRNKDGETISKMVLYFMVEDQAPVERIGIYIVGTGFDCEHVRHRKYLTTVQDPNGLVWHIFRE